MRYILIILVFLSVGANAQMVIKAHANYRPYAQPAANLLLDDYPNAAAAYSLRKLDKDYTGAAIRVRKDTTGQPESDIGFTASGDLDTAALKSFLNSRSGFVVTWYDQSGGGQNASQSTQANQPRIANLGVIERQNTKPSVRFDGDNDRLINDVINLLEPITYFLISKNDRTGTSNYSVFFDSYFTTSAHVFYRGALSDQNNNFSFAAGTGGQLNTSSNTNFNLFYILANQASSKLSINNNAEISATQSVGVNDLYGISIGNIRGNPTPVLSSSGLLGFISEFVIYNSEQSSNKTGIQSNINTYYAIY